MLPLFSVLSLAKKAYNFRESRKNGGEGESKPKKPMSATGKLRLFLGLPVIITAIALLLSVLCVYAGSKPGMMDNYAVFTLNTSRVGANVLRDINGAFKSVDIKFKRSGPMSAPVAMITPAPTTMMTMAQRDFTDDFETKIGSLTSKAGSKVTSAKSEVASKASSAQSAANSAANSAVASAQKKVIEIVNKAFRKAIEGLELKDIYNIHISSSCIGTYEYKDGKNYTSSDSTARIDELRPRIDSCEGHSAVNPFQIVRIIYWVGVVTTAVALVLGIYGDRQTVQESRPHQRLRHPPGSHLHGSCFGSNPRNGNGSGAPHHVRRRKDRHHRRVRLQVHRSHLGHNDPPAGQHGFLGSRFVRHRTRGEAFWG